MTFNFHSLLGRKLLLPSLTALLFLAVACGGAAGSLVVAGVGSGGTGFVTGFGSVILDGVRYDDALLDQTGRVLVEQADGTVTTGALGDLGLGQRLQIQSDAAEVLQQVQIQSEIVGVVEQVGSNFLTVAGQTVRENQQASLGPVTHLSGVSSLSQFQQGDRVEVHGSLFTGSTVPEIRASRIQLLPAVDANGNALIATKVTGVVSSVATGNGSRTFNLGGLTVALPDAATRTPSGYVPRNGELVKVFGGSVSSTGRLQATAIRLLVPTADFANYRVYGVVRSVNSQANSFQLDNLTVDASGVAGQLPSVGVAVRVTGGLTSATNTLKAAKIEFSDSQTRLVELKGSVTDYASLTSFRVRGIKVNASQVQGLASLSNGQFVEVKGQSVDDVVIAQQVKVDSPMEGDRLELTGPVSALNTSAKTFQIRQTLVNYSGAKFDNGSASSLVDGIIVDVKGRLNGSTLTATELEFQQEENEFEQQGVLRQNATAQGNSLVFTLGRLQFICTPDQKDLRNCTTNALRAGRAVELKYIVSNSGNIVTRLKIESEND